MNERKVFPFEKGLDENVWVSKTEDRGINKQREP